MLINSSLIARPPERNDVRILSVPANEIAMSLGNSQAANMVALGAIIKATGIISLEPIKSTMARMLSHKNSAEIIALNEQALDAGYNTV